MFGIGSNEAFIFLPFILSCAIGAWLATRKGRPAFGWGLLCFIFPIALLILLCLNKVPAAQGEAGPTRACPHCAEEIKAAAKVCKHCGRDVPEN